MMRMLEFSFVFFVTVAAWRSEAHGQEVSADSDLETFVKKQLAPEAVRDKVDYWLPRLRQSVFANDKKTVPEDHAYVLIRYERQKFNMAQAEPGELVRKAALWRLRQAVQQYQKAQPPNLQRKQLVDNLAKDLDLKKPTTVEQAVNDQLLRAVSPASKSDMHNKKIEQPFQETFQKATTALPKAWVVLLQAADAMQSVYGAIDKVPANLPEQEKAQLYKEAVTAAVKELEKKLAAKTQQAGITPSTPDRSGTVPSVVNRYAELRALLKIEGAMPKFEENTGDAPEVVEKHFLNNERQKQIVALIKALAKDDQIAIDKLDSDTLKKLALVVSAYHVQLERKLRDLEKTAQGITKNDKKASFFTDEQKAVLKIMKDHYEAYLKTQLERPQALIDPEDFLRTFELESKNKGKQP